MARQRINRISRWVLSKLEDAPLTQRELTQACSGKDRPYLPIVLEHLESDTRIVSETANHTGHGPKGKRWMKVEF